MNKSVPFGLSLTLLIALLAGCATGDISRTRPVAPPPAYEQDEVTYEYQWLEADFSVVLLRSDFVLVSEKNHVKMHKNQWLSTPLSPLDIPWRATNRGKHSEGWGADACAVT